MKKILLDKYLSGATNTTENEISVQKGTINSGITQDNLDVSMVFRNGQWIVPSLSSEDADCEDESICQDIQQ